MRPDASLSYKNATMKHLKIMACLLLLGCMAPATALCAGEHAPKRSRGKGHDRPYSETMYVKRQGGDLYISAKLDERTDITYWFRRCMFNELYTFYRVGITRNRAALPTTQPEAEPAVLLNSTYSDNIGPFAIPGCGWCGGNHKYRERTARTARSEGYTLLADGNRIEGDTTLWANRVTVEAENVILDPTRPYRNAAGGEELRDTLCRESVTYTVRRNNIEVAASHRFCNAAPVTIAIYYGMQSMFEGETHVLTPGGAYTDWTEAAKASTFTKQEYPLFRRYVEKNRQGTNRPGCCPTGWETTRCWTGRTTSSSMRPTARATTSSSGTNGWRTATRPAGGVSTPGSRRPSPTMPTCCATKAAPGDIRPFSSTASGLARGRWHCPDTSTCGISERPNRTAASAFRPPGGIN